MPKYLYVVKTKEGKSIREVAPAASKAELIARLRAKGMFIVSVKEVAERAEKPSFFSSFFRAKGKRSSIKLQDLTFFARNLATTLSSGVTLLRSLELIAVQTESAKLGDVLNSCCSGIRGGLSFSEVVAKYSNVFSSLWRGIIQVGETSGNLPFVLERLADYLELKMEFERKIKSALVYPAILVCAAFGAVIVFLKFILPKFTEIFREFDIVLPVPTQILFTISDIFQTHFYLIVGAVVLLVVAFFVLKKQPAVKAYWDRIGIKLPFLGDLMLIFFLERISSTMYILLDSGLPVVYALEVTADSMGNTFFKKIMLRIKSRVREGVPLSEELKKVEVFPILLSEMARIGEETGTMSEVFQKVSTFYQKDMTTRVERIIAAFEPLMIIFIGAVIGGIVLALFLPLFKISTMGI